MYILHPACFYLQHYSFYDFIINKARGKSGPLFSFDVHDDVRIVGDASLEKDEVRGMCTLAATQTYRVALRFCELITICEIISMKFAMNFPAPKH